MWQIAFYAMIGGIVVVSAMSIHRSIKSIRMTKEAERKAEAEAEIFRQTIMKVPANPMPLSPSQAMFRSSGVFPSELVVTKETKSTTQMRFVPGFDTFASRTFKVAGVEHVMTVKQAGDGFDIAVTRVWDEERQGHVAPKVRVRRGDGTQA